MCFIDVVYLKEIIGSFAGAFFAFLFFVVGQCWIKSNEKRDEMISNLDAIKEFVAMEITTIIFNKNKANELNNFDINKPIQIFVKRFELFVVANFFYTEINKYKLLESVIKFWASLKILNDDITTCNDTIKELSDFSRIAMIENKEKDYEQTMKANWEDLKNKTKMLLKSMEEIEKIPQEVISELNFCLWYEQTYFWNKFYYKFRYKCNKDFRKKMIDKIANKFKKYPC